MRWATYLCWLLACASLLAWAADASTVMRPWNSGVRVIEDLSANYRPYPDRIPSAATLLAETPLEAAGANCASAGACYKTGTAIDCNATASPFGTWVCNDTTQVNDGTQSMSATGAFLSWPAPKQIEAGHTTIYGIVDYYHTGLNGGSLSNLLSFTDTAGSPLNPSFTVQWLAGTDGTLQVSDGTTSNGATALCLVDGWSTIKFSIDTVTGTMQVWCNGTDFTGAADISHNFGTGDSDQIGGYGLATFGPTPVYFDRLRIWDSDPGNG